MCDLSGPGRWIVHLRAENGTGGESGDFAISDTKNKVTETARLFRVASGRRIAAKYLFANWRSRPPHHQNPL
ncbi:MAG: hypothetical protein D6744_03970 [Planctomycetota bacterium]|nr:MAG: hypothetical protein D6744_03970 [Planctomycetota bacterium]